ncbi:PREDICTED: uncharacterized protein LOC108766228 [Trachymyrmex cornetzi]|uniref:uncharacterized protein LOC108766228 n=1 Tax=Trachymyrmex cornetzi TaxID=471704 RepID=UPI00084F6137|nr:PREDICTED: uncharacterized protein LOC108766228 [Trachymyrmex cornetzi]
MAMKNKTRMDFYCVLSNYFSWILTKSLPSCTNQQYLISILSYATWIRLQPGLFTEWKILMIEVVYRFIPAIPEDIIVSLLYARCQTAVDLIRLCILARNSHQRGVIR